MDAKLAPDLCPGLEELRRHDREACGQPARSAEALPCDTRTVAFCLTEKGNLLSLTVSFSIFKIGVKKYLPLRSMKNLELVRMNFLECARHLGSGHRLNEALHWARQ